MYNEYNKINGTLFLYDEEGNIIGKENAQLDSVVFVKDVFGTKILLSGDDIDTQLKLSNVRESIADRLNNVYYQATTDLANRLHELRTQLCKAEIGSSKNELLSRAFLLLLGLVFIIAMPTAILLGGGDITAWWNVIENVKNFPKAFLASLAMFGVPWGIGAFYVVRSHFANLRKRVELPEEISSTESELLRLQNEQKRITDALEERQVRTVRISGESHYLEEFNRVLEASLAARLAKMQGLDELKRELQDILQGQELDALLAQGGISPEEIEKSKKDLGKILSFQPMDESQGQ